MRNGFGTKSEWKGKFSFNKRKFESGVVSINWAGVNKLGLCDALLQQKWVQLLPGKNNRVLGSQTNRFSEKNRGGGERGKGSDLLTVGSINSGLPGVGGCLQSSRDCGPKVNVIPTTTTPTKMNQTTFIKTQLVTEKERLGRPVNCITAQIDD